MVNLGDALSVIGILFGVCLSSWAVIMGFAALFPKKAEVACEKIQFNPWRSTVIGLLVWLVFGTLGLVMIQLPLPISKLLGTTLVMVLVAFTCVGASGLARLMGMRLRNLDKEMSEYAALSRGALIVVTTPLLPLVGWFAVIPMILAIGLGAGLSPAFTRVPASPDGSPHFEFGA